MDFSRYPLGSLKPAPFIEEAVPHEASTLRNLLEKNPKDTNVIHALGNILYHSDSLAEAEEQFLEFTKLCPKNPVAYCNLGIVRLRLDRLRSSLTSLDKAVKLNSKDKDAIYHQALVSARLGKFSSAKKQLSTIISDEDSSSLIFGLFAGICESLGEKEEAKKYYKLAFSEERSEEVSEKLLDLEFSRFKAYISNSNYLNASRELAFLSEKFGGTLNASRTVSDSLLELRNKIEESEELDKLVSAFRLSGSSKDSHLLFTTFYLSIGLMPEFFMELDKIESEMKRWTAALEERGDHPYAHFMIGICHSYRGDLEEALEKIQVCFDQLLPKKQESLRLKEIEKFLKFILYNSNEDEIKLSDASVNEWNQAGFESDFEIRLWREQGFSPEEAKDWNEAGVGARLAADCHKLKLSALPVGEFVKAGFSEAKAIRTWVKGEIDPDVATAWTKEFKGEETVALQFINIGIKTPEEAKEWLKVFSLPWDAAPWHQLDYSPKEAKELLAQGVKQPVAKSKKS